MESAVLTLRARRARARALTRFALCATVAVALASCRPWDQYSVREAGAEAGIEPIADVQPGDASEASVADAGDATEQDAQEDVGSVEASVEDALDATGQDAVADDARDDSATDVTADSEPFDAPSDSAPPDVRGDAPADAPTDGTSPALLGYAMIAAGERNSCAVTSSGRVVCWGATANGESGQYAIPPTVREGTRFERTIVSTEFTYLSGVMNPLSLSCAGSACCAVDADGSVKCWGNASDGQLGMGVTAPSPAPVAVALPGGARARAVVVMGRSRTRGAVCAVTTTDDVYCWGRARDGLIGGVAPIDTVEPPTLVVGNIAQLVSAGETAIALKRDGTVVSWGGSGRGQLGRATTAPNLSYIPSPVTLPAGTVTELFAGNDTTCARYATGSFACFGYIGLGRLFTEPTQDLNAPYASPAMVPGLSIFNRLCFGAHFACGVETTTSQVRCWGQGNGGILRTEVPGRGWTDTPEVITGSAVTPLTGLSCGAYTICRTRTDRSGACWGDDSFNQASGVRGAALAIAAPTPLQADLVTGTATAVTAGDGFTCALVGGRMQCWGLNGGPEGRIGRWEYPSVGSGRAGIAVSGTVTVRAPVAPVWPRFGEPTRLIAAGSDHVCAAFENVDTTIGSALACVGNPTALGYAPTYSSSVGRYGVGPMVSNAEVTDLAAGLLGTCVVQRERPTNSLRCWGGSVPLGMSPDLVRVTSAPATSVVNVPALDLSLEALVANGHRATAVRLAASTQPVFSAGAEVRGHGCIIGTPTSGTTPPRLYCWGGDGFNQLGITVAGVAAADRVSTGSSLRILRPLRADLLAPNDAGGVVSVALGARHTCAVFAGGAVRCAGHSGFGQLGVIDSPALATGNPVSFGTALTGGETVVEVSAGAWHTCARTQMGRVLCWGSNVFGQLGAALATTSTANPVVVPSLTGVTAIAAGSLHTCALKADGTVWCWGSNQYGELGRSTTFSLRDATRSILAVPTR